MDNNIIDARGRSCPEPVIMLQSAMKENSNNLVVLVDTQVAIENITRFAKNKGFQVSTDNKKDEFKITLKR